MKSNEPASSLHETAHGAMRVTHLAPGVVLHVCAGHLTLPIAELVTKDGDALLAAAGCCTFLVDCYDVRQFDPAFRQHMSSWFKRQRERNVTSHMLVRSKVLEMAIAVANMLAGTSFSKVYASVPAWELACQQAVSEFRRQPLIWNKGRASAP